MQSFLRGGENISSSFMQRIDKFLQMKWQPPWAQRTKEDEIKIGNSTIQQWIKWLNPLNMQNLSSTFQEKINLENKFTYWGNNILTTKNNR